MSSHGPTNRYYEQLISSDQAGGTWQHPIYGRRRRGGGAKLKRVIKMIKTVGSNIKDTGQRFVKSVLVNQGKNLAKDAITQVMMGNGVEAALKSAVKNNSKNVLHAAKNFGLEEIVRRTKKKGGRKKKKRTKKGGTKKKGKRKQKKKRGGRVKNRKLSSYSAGNQTKKRRVIGTYF